MPQRLLWASTSAKDPALPDGYYVSALAAAQTVNTMPEATLLAFGRHGEVGDLLSPDTTEAEAVIAGAARAGIDVDTLAAELQTQGAASFDASFAKLLKSIESKAATLRKA
jgi:transaldolase